MTVIFVTGDLFWACSGNVSQYVTDDATLTTAGQTHSAHRIDEQGITDITFPTAEEVLAVDDHIVAIGRGSCSIIIL